MVGNAERHSLFSTSICSLTKYLTMNIGNQLLGEETLLSEYPVIVP